MSVYVSRKVHPKCLGFAQAISNLKQAMFWDTKGLPLFDLLLENSPEIVVINSDDGLEKDITYAKKEFPDTKFILFKSGKKVENKEDMFDYTIYLDDVSQPTFLPYLTNEIYLNGEFKEQYETDFLIITDGLDSKNTFINNAVETIGDKFRLKVYGEVRLPSVYYLGRPIENEYKNLFKSAKRHIIFHQQWYNNSISNCLQSITHLKDFETIEELLERSANGGFAPPKESLKPLTYTYFTKKLLERLEQC